MKTAEEYVAAVLPPKGQGAQTLLFTADAVRAVHQALNDAEKYRRLLARATRNATPTV